MTTNTEQLKPCPFCGGDPKTTERPDNIDGTGFFFAVACYCGGYSACAHKMAVRKTPEQARLDATSAWNARALLAEDKVGQSDMKDAYVGARDDLLLWKRRALKAEELNRKFISEVNGPTFMGEPVMQVAEDKGEAVAWIHNKGADDEAFSYSQEFLDHVKRHPKLYGAHAAAPKPQGE